MNFSIDLGPYGRRRLRVGVAAAACAVLMLLPGCETADDEAVSGCGPVGETATCTCSSGLDGIRVCLGDGTYTGCDCSASEATACRKPGAEYACACPNGGQGTRYCLRDGGFSPCDCSGAGTAVAGSGAPTAGSGGGEQGCPSGYSCVEMEGFQICVDSSGIPPFCNAESDCAAEGLTGAMCTDPGVGTKVCVQLCG